MQPISVLCILIFHKILISWFMNFCAGNLFWICYCWESEFIFVEQFASACVFLSSTRIELNQSSHARYLVNFLCNFNIDFAWILSSVSCLQVITNWGVIFLFRKTWKWWWFISNIAVKFLNWSIFFVKFPVHQDSGTLKFGFANSL